MKQIQNLILLFVILFLADCKTKKTTSATTANAPVTSAPAAPVKSVNELQLEIAQARWQNTTAGELTEGQTIYTTKCTHCHKNYEVSRFSEAKWSHEIDDMSPKAKLIPEEKLKLTKYILSLREAKEKSKAN